MAVKKRKLKPVAAPVVKPIVNPKDRYQDQIDKIGGLKPIRPISPQPVWNILPKKTVVNPQNRPVTPKVSSSPQPVWNILPKKTDYSLQGNSISNSWGTLSGIRKKKRLI